MKKFISFLTRSPRRGDVSEKGLWAIIALSGIMLLTSLASCDREEWPEITNPGTDPDGSNTAWTNGEYRLKSEAANISDTLVIYQNVASTFAVLNSSNVVMANVSFNFGDGNATTGSTVSHSYAGTGVYTLSATFVAANGNTTTIKGPVKVVIYGEPIADEVVISIYHSMDGASNVKDTVGLAISNIDKVASQGSWFITGDFNGWLTPAKSTISLKTRIVNGKKYLLWPVAHALGLEKFSYGKFFLDSTSRWNYSPKSLYWHANSSGGGELWIYFTTTGISQLPEGSNLPGTFGDNSPTDWIIRQSLTYGSASATLNTFVHKTKVSNPSNPQLVYKIGENGTWTSKALTDGTNYSASIDNIPYGTIVYYYILAKANDIKTKIAFGTSGYNADASACLLMINDPYK